MGESKFTPELVQLQSQSQNIPEKKEPTQKAVLSKRRYLELAISDRMKKWQAEGYDLRGIRNLLPEDFKESIVESADSQGRHSISFNMDTLLDLIESASTNFYFLEPTQTHKDLSFVTLPPNNGHKVDNQGLGNTIERGKRELKLLRISDMLRRENFDSILLSGEVHKDQWRQLPYDGLYLADANILIIVCDEVDNMTFVIHGVESEDEASTWLSKTKIEIKSAPNSNDIHSIMYSHYADRYEDRVLAAIKGVRNKTREKVATGKSLEERAAQHGLRVIDGEPGLYLNESTEEDILWASSGYLNKLGINDTQIKSLKAKFVELPPSLLYKTGPQLKDAPDIQLMNFTVFKNEYDRVINTPEMNEDGVTVLDNGIEFANDLHFVKLFKGSDDIMVRRGLNVYKTLHKDEIKEARQHKSTYIRKVYKVEDVYNFLTNYGCLTERENLPVIGDSKTITIEGKEYITKGGIYEIYNTSNPLRRFMALLEDETLSSIPTKKVYLKEGQLKFNMVYDLDAVRRHLEKIGVTSREEMKTKPKLNAQDEIELDGVQYVSLPKIEKLTKVDVGNLKKRFLRNNLSLKQAIKSVKVTRPDGAEFTNLYYVDIVEKEKALEIYNVRDNTTGQ